MIITLHSLAWTHWIAFLFLHAITLRDIGVSGCKGEAISTLQLFLQASLISCNMSLILYYAFALLSFIVMLKLSPFYSLFFLCLSTSDDVVQTDEGTKI